LRFLATIKFKSIGLLNEPFDETQLRFSMVYPFLRTTLSASLLLTPLGSRTTNERPASSFGSPAQNGCPWSTLLLSHHTETFLSAIAVRMLPFSSFTT
jgi:hypothetical protein